MALRFGLAFTRTGRHESACPQNRMSAGGFASSPASGSYSGQPAPPRSFCPPHSRRRPLCLAAARPADMKAVKFSVTLPQSADGSRPPAPVGHSPPSSGITAGNCLAAHESGSAPCAEILFVNALLSRLASPARAILIWNIKILGRQKCRLFAFGSAKPGNEVDHSPAVTRPKRQHRRSGFMPGALSSWAGNGAFRFARPDAVSLRSLPGGHRLLDGFKDAQ